jgi:hypothetical protein
VIPLALVSGSKTHISADVASVDTSRVCECFRLREMSNLYAGMQYLQRTRFGPIRASFWG